MKHQHGGVLIELTQVDARHLASDDIDPFGFAQRQIEGIDDGAVKGAFGDQFQPQIERSYGGADDKG